MGIEHVRCQFSFERNPRYVLPPNVAVKELWRNLTSGEIFGSGTRVTKAIRCAMGAVEWYDIKPIDCERAAEAVYGTHLAGRHQYNDVKLAVNDVLRLWPERASEGDPQTVEAETREALPATPIAARNPRMSKSDMDNKLPPFLKELEVDCQRKGLRFNQETARKAAEEGFKRVIDRERFRAIYRNAGLNQVAGPRRKIPPKS